jgi:predicted phosphate transport protein (TIGR00153 family)
MSFLRKALSQGKREQKVLEKIKRHLGLLCDACNFFKNAMENNNPNLMHHVAELEREGDSIRRKIISDVYEGAFLPYLRSDLCKFVEMVDNVFDAVKDTASYYLDTRLPHEIREECVRVALLNVGTCEMLSITFDAMLQGEDLHEKTLAIRIYEKKVDDIKFSLFRDVRKAPVENFWDGRILADFITGLTGITDIIEDASDYLQIISVSMR